MPWQKIERLTDQSAFRDRKTVRIEAESVFSALWSPIDIAQRAVDDVSQVALGSVPNQFTGNNATIYNVLRPLRRWITWQPL